MIVWHVITVLQDYYKSLIDGNNWSEIAVKEQLPLFLLVNVMYGTYPLDDKWQCIDFIVFSQAKGYSLCLKY